MKKIISILIAVSFVLATFNVADAKTVVKEEYKGKFGRAVSTVTVHLMDEDTIVVTPADYLKYFTYVDIGIGLKIKPDKKADYETVIMLQTSEAKKKNDEYICLVKISKANKEILREARKKAKRQAKQKYEKTWNLKSEKMSIPSSTNGHTKTYMDYRSVTAKGSPQYALLNGKHAKSKKGFRMVDGYYCIALGSFYGSEIGTKYYIDLSNGKRIRCILGDQKSNRHTDPNHQFAVKNRDIMEFIVDKIKLSGGDISAIDGFEGHIVQIRKITDERAYKNK